MVLCLRGWGESRWGLEFDMYDAIVDHGVMPAIPPPFDLTPMLSNVCVEMPRVKEMGWWV
jgi:hypothetical protein